MRAHLAELGLIAARGRYGLQTLIGVVKDRTSELPDLARRALQIILDQLAVGQQIGGIERHIHTEHRSNEASRRLETIPGIGVIGAAAIAATVPDPKVFKSGREYGLDRAGTAAELHRRQRAARLDLQQGRPLSAATAPVVGATAVIRHARTHSDKHPWLLQLLARRPAKVVAVPLPNKMAPIA